MKDMLKKVFKHWEMFLVIFLILEFVVFGAANPKFLRPQSIMNSIVNYISVCIISLFVTMVMITGGIDIQAPSIIGLTSIIIGVLWSDVGMNVWMAALIAVAAAAVCGALSGFFIAYCGVQPMVVTLGGSFLYSGLALLISGMSATPAYKGISGFPGKNAAGQFVDFRFLGKGKLFGIPMQIVVYIALILLCIWILHRSKYGERLFLIGVNPQAAEYSGINTRATVMSTYVLSAAGRALLCDGSVTGAALGSSEAAVPFADAGLAEEDGALRGVSAAVVVQIERAAGTEQYAIRLGGTSDAVYLACRSNSEQLNTAQDTGTSLSRWVISMEDGHMTIRSARYLSRTLQYDADAGCFRCYAKTKTPLTVYRGETSSLWYTTQPKMHDHQLVETGRREPTCTMSGWIDFRCTICGELRRQPLEPLGHEVVNGICVRCGEVMQLPFRDVPEDAYYYDAVVWGLSRGVVNGTTMTTFSPDLSCTRAQAAAFLWRAAGRPEPSGNTAFADVPADSYYAAAVAWAAENNVTNGTGSGCFSPDDLCTRAQIVTLLYRQLTKEI